ncbi:MAG: DsbA family protein [Armatimonadetes bacterium]|nr:DsbA family protein [Armatimonadota bacterium]
MRSKRRSRKGLWAIVGVVAVAGAIGAAVLHWRTAAPPAAAPPPPAPEGSSGTARGRLGAPVTLEIFSDFRCKYCGILAESVEPLIVSEYVNKGIVRMVYRQFPVGGPLSEQAAEASLCAADQGKFWAYHGALFARLPRGELRGAGDLDSAAREIGLDQAAFTRCLRSGQMRARVAADMNEGLRRGVQGTPTSFVGGRAIVGAQPIEVFRAAIEAARPR